MQDEMHPIWKAGDSEETVWRADIDDWDYHPSGGTTTSQPVMQDEETVCLVVGEGWDDTEFNRRLALIVQAPTMMGVLAKIVVEGVSIHGGKEVSIPRAVFDAAAEAHAAATGQA